MPEYKTIRQDIVENPDLQAALDLDMTKRISEGGWSIVHNQLVEIEDVDGPIFQRILYLERGYRDEIAYQLEKIQNAPTPEDRIQQLELLWFQVSLKRTI